MLVLYPGTFFVGPVLKYPGRTTEKTICRRRRLQNMMNRVVFVKHKVLARHARERHEPVRRIISERCGGKVTITTINITDQPSRCMRRLKRITVVVMIVISILSGGFAATR